MIQAVRHADIITDLNKYTEFVSFQVAVMDVAKITDFLIWNTSNHALEEPTGNWLLTEMSALLWWAVVL